MARAGFASSVFGAGLAPYLATVMRTRGGSSASSHIASLDGFPDHHRISPELNGGFYPATLLQGIRAVSFDHLIGAGECSKRSAVGYRWERRSLNASR